MIANKKYFYSGLVLMFLFGAILIVIFSPVFGGQNGLKYLDNLYNSISKGSAYYIPKVRKEAEKFSGSNVNLLFSMHDKTRAQQVAGQFQKNGAQVVLADEKIRLSGDLGKILSQILDDSDLMYYNKGRELSEKYGIKEKEVLYNWWIALLGMDKDLKAKSKFAEAKVIDLLRKKAVESSFNYYGIEPQKITDRMGIVIFSLIFYVIYTLWYGYAILYMMEGWGLRLEH